MFSGKQIMLQLNKNNYLEIQPNVWTTGKFMAR